MRVVGNFGPKILVRGHFGPDCLQGKRVIHLFPVDLAQQLLDAVFRAKYPDFYILNERRIRLMNKEVPIHVIDLFPSAILGAAKK